MAKVNHKAQAAFMLLAIVVAMVLFRPPADTNRATYGNSDGFVDLSREGTDSGKCSYSEEGYDYSCYYTDYSYKGTNAYVEVAMTSSYKMPDLPTSHVFRDEDGVRVAVSYYYPFYIRYNVVGTNAYYKFSDKKDDWIKCGETGCDADSVPLNGVIQLNKETLSEKPMGSDGKTYFYITGWSVDSAEKLFEVLENDFGDDIVLDEPYIDTYTSWANQGMVLEIYASSAGNCAVDDDCLSEEFYCSPKGDCLEYECTADFQCSASEICVDNSCEEVECASDSSCDNGYCDQEGFYCVADQDDDLVADAIDNCPEKYNPNQDDEDNDGLGDFCDSVVGNDADGDGVENSFDNCPQNYNYDQEDVDGDGLGDVCDPVPDDSDKDGDGVNNFFDNCPEVFNPWQYDWDSDGLGDECDYYDNIPKTSSIGSEGGVLITFPVALEVDDNDPLNGDLVTNDFLKEYSDTSNPTNYYLYFIVLVVGFIAVYELVRRFRK